MASGEQIASLFASLGFKVDDRGAKQFEKRLQGLEQRLKSLGKTQRQNPVEGKGHKGGASQTDKHAKSVTRLTTRYDKFGGALMRVKDDMRRTNDLYVKGNLSATKRNELLQRMTREYDRLAAAKRRAEMYGERGRGRPSRMGPKARGLMSGFVPGFGGAFAAAGSVSAYQQSIGMEQGLTSATGSLEQAGKDMEYLEEVSKRLGLYLGDVGRSFTQMSAAARGSVMEGQGVRDIFEGISSQARVLNLSAADTEGIFRAVTQIMNKKQVMAEELKNQLGERMPGAIQATARALNMFTESGEADTEALFKAMENGELTAERVLPKLAEEMQRSAEVGGALENAMNNTSAAINRFRTQLFLSNRTFNESGFDESVGSLFDRMSTALAEAEPLWILMGRSARWFGAALEAPIELAGTLASKLGFLTEEGFEFTDRAKRMTMAAVAFVKPLRKMAFWVFLLPAGFAALNDLIENGFSSDSWGELATKIGAVALAVGGLLFKFRRLFTAYKNRPKWLGGSKGADAPTGRTGRSGGGAGSPQRSGGGGSMPKFLRGAGIKGALGVGARFLGPIGWAYTGFEGAMALANTETGQRLLSGMKDNAMNRNQTHREQLVRDQAAANFPMHANTLGQRLANLNGDVVFNIESNNPKEVSESVRETIDDMFRGASLQNPEVEQ